MTPDRRRHRIRGLLSRLSWPLRQGWTSEDQRAYDLWDRATHGPDPTVEQLYPLDFVNGGLGPMMDVHLSVVSS